MLLAAVVCLSCEDEHSTSYAPLTAACDACLSQRDDSGCRAQWDACTALPECEESIVCALRVQCYVEEDASGCEQDAGCGLPSDASGAAVEAADAFETCARTHCAEPCRFSAP